MKRCRHRGLGMDLFVQYQANGEVHDATDANSKPIAWRCVKCGDYASLGHANDDGEHAAQVAVEVRAAELATGAHMDEWYGTHWLVGDWTDEEARGWSIAETNMQNHTDRWHAGYLARYIATHPDGGNE